MKKPRMLPFTARLDKALRTAMDLAARRDRLTSSELVRRALHHYLGTATETTDAAPMATTYK